MCMWLGGCFSRVCWVYTQYKHGVFVSVSFRALPRLELCREWSYIVT